MIKIQRIILKNFRNYTKETTIDLDNRGLTLIMGPNGAGKSSIPEALFFGLFGKTFGALKDDLINDVVKKNCAVVIEAEVEGKKLVVLRTRKHKKVTKDLKVVYDNNTLEGTPTDIQRELEDILGISPIQFLLITLFTPHKARSFANATPGERINIFADFANLKHFDDAYKETHGMLTKLLKDLVVTEQTVDSVEQNIKNLKEQIDSNDDNRKKWNQEKKKTIENLEAELVETEKEVAKLGEKPKVDNVEEEVNKIDTAILKLESNLVKLTKEKTKAEGKLEDTIDFEGEVGKPCPTCTRKITENLIAKIKKNNDEIEKKVREQIEGLMPTIEKYEERIGKGKDKRREVEEKRMKQRDALNEWSQKKEFHIYTIQNTKKLLKVAQEETNPYEGIKDKFEKDIEKFMNKIKNEKKEINRQNNLKNLLIATKDLWKDLKFLFATECISSLETETRRVLDIISEGSMDIGIKLTDKNEIDLEITIDGKTRAYDGQASSGERQRVDCALIFGFNRMAVGKDLPSINIIFLDEILDASIDEDGELELFDFLENLAEKIESVFVISHKAGLKQMFSKTWEIINGEIEYSS